MSKLCPICGSNSVRPQTLTETFEYKGHSIPIEKYQIYSCGQCGEATVDGESRKRAERILRDAQRSIDGFLTSKEIKSIRKSFKKTQTEFSILLGGGEKAFTRYETGRILQSKPMDNLLRILRDYPDAMECIVGGETEKDPDSTVSVYREADREYQVAEENPYDYVVEGNTMRFVGDGSN